MSWLGSGDRRRRARRPLEPERVQEPTYLVERDAPVGPPLDPTTRWYRRAVNKARGHTYDAYPDHLDVPWRVVGPEGPNVAAKRKKHRSSAPHPHPAELYVKHHGKLREVKFHGTSLENVIGTRNRRLMAGWVMDEIANTLAQMEEDDMTLEHRRNDEMGQGLAEYALILALIAIVAIAALLILGNQIQSVIQTIADCLPGGVGC